MKVQSHDLRSPRSNQALAKKKVQATFELVQVPCACIHGPRRGISVGATHRVVI
jgi:hypothetical protein